MLILFDNGTPAPLGQVLHGHIVVEAIDRGWDRLINGELIAAAEAAGFELLLTTVKNMHYQQNLADRKIASVVLGNQQWPTLRRYVDRVVAAVDAATPGAIPKCKSSSVRFLHRIGGGEVGSRRERCAARAVDDDRNLDDRSL